MKAHQLLTDESKWCKGANARDASGKAISSTRLDAVSFCVRGAIYRAYDGSFEKAQEVFDKVWDRIKCDLAVWNDAPRRTFAEVKAVLVELDL